MKHISGHFAFTVQNQYKCNIKITNIFWKKNFHKTPKIKIKDAKFETFCLVNRD